MATDTEIIDVLVRLRGGRAAAAEADTFAAKIGAIGRTAGGVGVALGAMGAIGAGIRFDSTMEQNQIAFEQFLGSAEAAKTEIAALLDLSNRMPQFGFGTFASDAKKLLAMGDPIDRVNSDLSTLADTASGLGLGSEGIDRMVLALGQMRSTGVVQGDELRQLQEAGIKVYDYMIKAGVITRSDIGQIGNMHIDAARAIDAIMTGMQTDFGGLSERARGTWQTQLGAVKNYGAQAAGALVEPIVKLGESTVLPYIAGQLKQAAEYLRGGGAQDFYDTLGRIAKILGPLVAAMLAYRAALLLVAAAEWAVAAGSAAMALGGTLGTVLRLVPAITSLSDGLYLLSGAAGAAGLSMAGVYTLGIAFIIAGLVALYLKFQWFRDAVALIGQALYLEFVQPWVGLYEALIGPFKAAMNWIISHWNSLKFVIGKIHLPGIPDIGGISLITQQIPLLASGGQVPVGGTAIVGDAGPELLQNRGGTAVVSPMGGGSRQMAHFVLMLPDMRVLAEGVAEEGMTAHARGG